MSIKTQTRHIVAVRYAPHPPDAPMVMAIYTWSDPEFTEPPVIDDRDYPLYEWVPNPNLKARPKQTE